MYHDLKTWLTSAVLCVTLTVNAQVVTRNPKVEEASVPYVSIVKVEITKEHTAIYFRFKDDRNAPPQIPQGIPPQFRDFYRQESSPSIWIDPNTRLYKPGDIETKFRFLRAEGIPTTTKRDVQRGEVIEFVAYFEPVTPGIEVIDFYEGRSTQNTTAWNFYGIHINNPDPKKKPKPAETPKPVEPEVAAKAPETPAAAAEEAAFAGLNATVVDAKSGQPVPARISYVEDGDTVSIHSSSGKYRIGLTPGRTYTFKVTSKGYAEDTWQLDTPDSSNLSVRHEFRLTRLAEGTSFTLDNIYFETSSYTLLKESFQELDKFAGMLLDNPSVHIRIEGHSDNVGDFDKNVTLSRNRAEAVRNYLIGKGIDPARMEAKGYGPTKPVSKGNTEAERQKNRRVEVVIVKS